VLAVRGEGTQITPAFFLRSFSSLASVRFCTGYLSFLKGIALPFRHDAPKAGDGFFRRIFDRLRLFRGRLWQDFSCLRFLPLS